MPRRHCNWQWLSEDFLGLVLHSLPSARVFRFESDTLRKLHSQVVRCDDHDDRTGQFPIWDRIGRVDGCVSVTFKSWMWIGRWNRLGVCGMKENRQGYIF
jgi:hypothetical protein